MTRDQARRRYDALSRMTTARGCTPAEAATARRLAASLAARWGFGTTAPRPDPPPRYSERYTRAEQHAARRFRWEYRQCGKRRCRCYRGALHGPYKYAKVRRDGRPVSVYLGR